MFLFLYNYCLYLQRKKVRFKKYFKYSSLSETNNLSIDKNYCTYILIFIQLLFVSVKKKRSTEFQNI